MSSPQHHETTVILKLQSHAVMSIRSRPLNANKIQTAREAKIVVTGRFSRVGTKRL